MTTEPLHRHQEHDVVQGATTRYHCTLHTQETDDIRANRDCLATAAQAVAWLLELALDHPKTVAVRVDTRGQRQHHIATGAQTRHTITELIGPALVRGDTVTAEVTISSLVRPRKLTVTLADDRPRTPRHATTTASAGIQTHPVNQRR